jgi:hypothetical protein
MPMTAAAASDDGALKPFWLDGRVNMQRLRQLFET